MPHRTYLELRSFVVDFLVRGVVDNVARPLVGLYCLVIVLLVPVDAYECMRSPYYYIDVTRPHWRWEYVQTGLLLFVGAVPVLGIIIASYRRPQHRLFRRCSRLAVVACFVLIVISFYRWALTGFDHE